MFALGMDCLSRFNQWDSWQELLELAEFVPIARDYDNCQSWEEIEIALGIDNTIKLRNNLISNPDIGSASSSEIRRSLAEGQSLRPGLLPEAVAQYIRERRLYI